MDDIAEKRVFSARTGVDELVVAGASGLVVVSLSADRVGRYTLARRCAPTDLAVGPGDGRLAVATTDDVLVAADAEVDELASTGFGPAAAITFDGGRIVAAGPEGRMAGRGAEGWTPLGTLSGPPTALAGDLAATADGVVRLTGDGIRSVGLDDVTDLARLGGVPLAATAAGLYQLGNGWVDVLSGAFELVSGDSDGRAHAATAAAFYEHQDGEWGSVDLPVDEPVTAVAYGETTYALTVAGDLLVRTADGWRAHPLGVDGVVAAALR